MATATVPITRQPFEDQAVELAINGLSAHTRRAYQAHIKRWRTWANGLSLDRVCVKGYMRALELQGASSQVRNQALAALKKLAYEASELGWIDPAAATQVGSIKSKPIRGVRTGKWLNRSQAAALLMAPDGETMAGKRDRCVLALLIGCGLRRSEACALNIDQIKTLEDGRMILANLHGKGGRIRSVLVPVWVAQLIEAWMKEVKTDRLLRSIRLDGHTLGNSLSSSMVHYIIGRYGRSIGVPDLAPHDLRRTHARLARLGGAPLETIQHSLGHASIKTTEIYVKTGEEANAGDFIKL